MEKNTDSINWSNFSENPNALHLLQQNMDKINWSNFSENPNIFTYDYDKMKRNRINSGIIEELFAKVVFHPDSFSS